MESATKAPEKTPEPPPPIPSNRVYWQEFFRVETDKFLLVGLIVFLQLRHVDEKFIYAAMGGLLGAIQQQRFKW